MANVIKIPLISIVLQRDGKQVVPTVGTPFSFTEEELADVEKVVPQGAFRDPINETPVAPVATKPKSAKAAADGEL